MFYDHIWYKMCFPLKNVLANSLFSLHYFEFCNSKLTFLPFLDIETQCNSFCYGCYITIRSFPPRRWTNLVVDQMKPKTFSHGNSSHNRSGGVREGSNLRVCGNHAILTKTEIMEKINHDFDYIMKIFMIVNGIFFNHIMDSVTQLENSIMQTLVYI